MSDPKYNRIFELNAFVNGGRDVAQDQVLQLEWHLPGFGQAALRIDREKDLVEIHTWQVSGHNGDAYARQASVPDDIPKVLIKVEEILWSKARDKARRNIADEKAKEKQRQEEFEVDAYLAKHLNPEPAQEPVQFHSLLGGLRFLRKYKPDLESIEYTDGSIRVAPDPSHHPAALNKALVTMLEYGWQWKSEFGWVYGRRFRSNAKPKKVQA